jgi:hypothetical protein
LRIQCLELGLPNDKNDEDDVAMATAVPEEMADPTDPIKESSERVA